MPADVMLVKQVKNLNVWLLLGSWPEVPQAASVGDGI